MDFGDEEWAMATAGFEHFFNEGEEEEANVEVTRTDSPPLADEDPLAGGQQRAEDEVIGQKSATELLFGPSPVKVTHMRFQFVLKDRDTQWPLVMNSKDLASGMEKEMRAEECRSSCWAVLELTRRHSRVISGNGRNVLGIVARLLWESRRDESWASRVEEEEGDQLVIRSHLATFVVSTRNGKVSLTRTQTPEEAHLAANWLRDKVCKTVNPNVEVCEWKAANDVWGVAKMDSRVKLIAACDALNVIREEGDVVELKDTQRKKRSAPMRLLYRMKNPRVTIRIQASGTIGFFAPTKDDMHRAWARLSETVAKHFVPDTPPRQRRVVPDGRLKSTINDDLLLECVILQRLNALNGSDADGKWEWIQKTYCEHDQGSDKHSSKQLEDRFKNALRKAKFHRNWKEQLEPKLELLKVRKASKRPRSGAREDDAPANDPRRREIFATVVDIAATLLDGHSRLEEEHSADILKRIRELDPDEEVEANKASDWQGRYRVCLHDAADEPQSGDVVALVLMEDAPGVRSLRVCRSGDGLNANAWVICWAVVGAKGATRFEDLRCEKDRDLALPYADLVHVGIVSIRLSQPNNVKSGDIITHADGSVLGLALKDAREGVVECLAWMSAEDGTIVLHEFLCALVGSYLQ